MLWATILSWRIMSMTKSVNVLVMDDADVIRKLVVAILTEIPQINEIIQAKDAGSAVKLMTEHQPQIAILDVKVPGNGEVKNGIDVLKWTKKFYPNTAVIMLTNHVNERYREECKRAGANFFFDKSSEFDQLTGALDTLMADMVEDKLQTVDRSR